MSKYTTNLNLYEKENTDLDDTFNISTMLNNNWEIIDDSFGEINNSINSQNNSISTHESKIATEIDLGHVKVDNKTIKVNSGVISAVMGGTVGNHQIFVELSDPTTITGYTVKNNDIWFDLTNKVIKYYNSGWQMFSAIYTLN